MGYIPNDSGQTYAVAYLTETGRSYLFNKDNNRFDEFGDDLFEITKFALSDSDTNYLTGQLLGSGDVPDVTGNKNSSCLKTCSNYVQSNLIAYLFDSTPTNVVYGTNLPGGSSPELNIPVGGIPPLSPGENPPPIGGSGPSNPGPQNPPITIPSPSPVVGPLLPGGVSISLPPITKTPKL